LASGHIGGDVKVLVIGEREEEAQSIRVCLNLAWSQVNMVTAARGEDGIDMVETEAPDVAMLDLELPDTDGFSVLERIRAFSDVPVIILSERQAEMDKARALETGADDYITKPFNPIDLLTRVKAVLRRAGMPQLKQANSSLFTCGKLTIDFASRDVLVSGKLVKLTPLEYNLLCNLVRNEGKVISHRALMEKTWGPGYTDDVNFLKKYIYRLRMKLNSGIPSHRMLVNERGIGYKFVKAD
jgi:DNA-binding response OmpR family regulator